MTSEELTAFLGRSPFVGFLGVRFALSGDELTVSLPYREGLIGNPMVPALHGGALAAMLEIAAIAQLFIQRELTDFPKPVDVSVDYLRVGRPVDTFARAHVARGGARIANVRAEAWQSARAEPIVALHGHFLLPAPKPA